VSVLLLDNIYKSYKQGREEFNVLSDLRFQLDKGNVVALVGPSGSGKSTFLLIAGLLESANSGSVVFDGINCSKISEAKLTQIRRDNIGFIYQFHHLLPEFTALENVMIPNMLVESSIDKVKKRSINILQELGLAERINNLPSELSGGEQQRVAVARSLINQPKLILADEPTGNLDNENAEKVINLIINQAKERKLAAIIVTHNIELARKTGKVFTIRNGKVYEITGNG
jgi:lipoprotein-releasing system ATP-binding protein